MKQVDLYRAFHSKSESGENARALLSQMHWFAVNAEFDPKTGEALPQVLSAFLAKVAQQDSGKSIIRDRLWRITEHSRAAVERLFRALNESPRREQALLPVHAVRELDANSFIKLSNRPGRNIREKLAGKPYLQAVRRFQSVNLPENRLLKAFVIRLAELLETRRDYLGQEDELLPKIQSWLRSDEAQAIARWDNLPPNNTLLLHQDYRRVWDAWYWLETLDADIHYHLTQLEACGKRMRLWNEYAQKWAAGYSRFADMPILFDYGMFEIQPGLPRIAVQQVAKKIDRNVSVKEISQPVCVDLTTLRPGYAVTSRKQSLPEAFLWQRWKIEKQTVNIELFNSDAAYILPEVTSISVSDLFFCKNSNSDDLDQAARTFASRLRGMFRNDTLIWLVPDSLNDFELDITRRNLNACFPNAEPLPRSIAAAFEQVDRARIKDNYPIVVVDTIGGKTCVTKLIARFDPELKARIPETGGFYWERQPPVVIAGTDSESTQQKAYDLSTLNEKGQWNDPVHPAKLPFIDVAMLKRDSRIGSFAFAIFLTESPVSGGVRLYNLQQQAGDIPLWRDQIPELSIKVRKDGFFQRFYLISRGTNVRPIRGRPVSITVKENFTLSAGQDDYQFPLFLGDSAEDLGFSARLDSPAFPLRYSAICQLDLSFEYGADDPYKLIFRSLDNAFPPVKATWQRTEEVIITDAPAPEYPLPLVWADLQSWIDVQGNQIDLLRWLNDSLFRLYELIPTYSAITISSRWNQKKDPNNETYWFSFATTQRGERCYCNTKRFTVVIDFDPNDRFPCGTELYCRTQHTKEGGISAVDISIENNQSLSYEAKQRMISFKERSLQNRMSLIWGDARSLKNLACSMEFREKFIELSAMLLSTLPSDIINRKIFPLLACTHKDAPDLCIQWITGQVKNGVIYDTRAIGFSLGDVSEPWQEYILSELIKRPNNDTLRIFAYAIWRDQHFVEKFDLVQLKLILNSLKMILGQIRPCPPRKNPKDKLTIRNWVRNTTEPLELLLGLLRTRNASDPDIRMLLQPRQKITVELAKLVEHVTELVAQSNVSLFSRVQLSIEKPEGDRTPDLLYALYLYLTGDDGVNAIHITSVSDREDE